MVSRREQDGQRQKFIAKAREIGCDETTSTVFERAFSEIVLPKRRIRSQMSKQSKTQMPDQ